MSLAIASLTSFGANIPRIEASFAQRQEIPTKANNWFFQGLQKAIQEDYQGAVSDFTKAIQINPNYAEAYYQRGMIYAKYASGKPLKRDGTLPGCEKIDGYRIICNVKMTSNWKKENQKKAITDFNRAILLNNQYAEAYHERGLVQEEKQKKNQDFQRAIELYFQKNSVELNQNKYEQASDILERIEKLYAEEEFLMAQGLKRKESSEHPLNSSTASSLLKQSPEELMNEARQYIRKGDKQSALQKYREAALIFRDKKDIRYQQVQQIIIELEQNSNG